MSPETKALNVIKSTYNPRAGIYWTGGKDSTLMLYLIRTLKPKIINPVVILDSGVEFPEIYDFIDKVTKLWSLNIKKYYYKAPNVKQARLNKIKVLKKSVKDLDLKKIYVAIRRDEQAARSKEDYISSRKDHIRIHPILDFTEEYLWEYTKKNKIPYCPLYDQGYRSLGEAPFTKKGGKTERSGREPDKELIMKRLRQLGYF